MTILAVGRGLRDLATKGMAGVSQAENIENQQRLALKTAQQQQQASTMGTGAGVGGMIGANKMLGASKAAKTAIDSANVALGGAGELGKSALGRLTYTTGAETLVGDAALGAAKTAALEGAGQAAVTGAEAVATGAEAVAAVEAAGAASQAAGPMAQLASLAGPVAIGLGVAFLLHKLFD